MLIRFKSQATADLLMLEADARAALRLVGKPDSHQGVITPEQLPQAIACLQRAAQEDRALQQQEDHPENGGSVDTENADPDVRLSQRLVPLLQMLERAREAEQTVIWSDGQGNAG